MLVRIARESSVPHDVPHAYCCCTSRRENTCPATSQGQVGLKDSSPSNHPLIIRTRRPPGRPSVPHSQQRLSTSNQWMRPCCNVQFRPVNGAISRILQGHSGEKEKIEEKKARRTLAVDMAIGMSGPISNIRFPSSVAGAVRVQRCLVQYEYKPIPRPSLFLAARINTRAILFH
jgi:hypothetical protein